MTCSPERLSFYCGTAEKFATITTKDCYLDDNQLLMGWCTGCEEKCPKELYGRVSEHQYVLLYQIASEKSKN